MCLHMESIPAKRHQQIRNGAARYVTNRHGNRSCVTDMLSNLGWKSLETHMKEARLCMRFKIKHELVAINTSDILIESQNFHNARLVVFPENNQGLEQTTSRHCVSRVDWGFQVSSGCTLCLNSFFTVYSCTVLPSFKMSSFYFF